MNENYWLIMYRFNLLQQKINILLYMMEGTFFKYRIT